MSEERAAVDVQEFADRLKETIAVQAQTRSGYVFGTDLVRAIEGALNPHEEVEGYPRMVYHEGDSQRTRIVKDRAEEDQAMQAGYVREPRPREEGYPRIYCERRPWDRRSVVVTSSSEEEQFLAAVEIGNWSRDDTYQMGGRGVFLHDIIAERKELMKRLVDQSPLVESEKE